MFVTVCGDDVAAVVAQKERCDDGCMAQDEGAVWILMRRLCVLWPWLRRVRKCPGGHGAGWWVNRIAEHVPEFVGDDDGLCIV